MAVPFVEAKPESDVTREWPPHCPWCGKPTEPVEEMLADCYRLRRPRYDFWCWQRHKIERQGN